MKYDLSKPISHSAERTLAAFSEALFQLLAEKAFEEISAGEICLEARFPRSTFYNYFDDKFDLLNYCWITLTKEIGLGEYRHTEENEMLYLYFDRIYDFTQAHLDVIDAIISHNPEVGYMFSSFHSFLNREMRIIFKDCQEASRMDIPNELLADHYSNTLFLVWEWATRERGGFAKEKAHSYLKLLLSGLHA